MMRHLFDPEVLREYDIRGRVGENLSEHDAFVLGLSFGTYISSSGGNLVCVGYDGRLTSPILADALIKGLMQTGMRVISIGLGPSPLLYFSVKHLDADAGIMVTGSHNPPEYNGFKLTLRSGPLFGHGIQEIGQIASRGVFCHNQGSLHHANLQDAYVSRLLQDLQLKRPLRIAWDCGNGSAGEILKRLTNRIEGEHVLLYCDIDGRFPYHHPDPTVDSNLKDLQETVVSQRCDLGIAFDGDGDRIGVVDENGQILRCDTLLILYAREVLSKFPGASIIGDVKCSQVLFDSIHNLGGKPVMWKTGHSVIKSKMIELDAPLAGELSGHIFFADRYYGYDDALYCAIRLLNELDSSIFGLSYVTQHIPVLFNTPEIRLEVKESEKFSLVSRVIQNLLSTKDPGLKIDHTDGVRVTNPDGWWLLRASNTQNAIVIRIEAFHPEGLIRLQTLVDEELRKVGYTFSH